MIRRIWAEIRWLLAVAHWLLESAGYWIRPYDILADKRRWKWQPRQRCGFSYGIHQPTEACDQIHCHGCGHDHTGKAWRWCFECGHAYRTPRELRRAYRRKVWEMLRGDLRDPSRVTGPSRVPWLLSNAWHPSMARCLWYMLTARASRIDFCQICLHDFL